MTWNPPQSRQAMLPTITQHSAVDVDFGADTGPLDFTLPDPPGGRDYLLWCQVQIGTNAVMTVESFTTLWEIDGMATYPFTLDEGGLDTMTIVGAGTQHLFATGTARFSCGLVRTPAPACTVSVAAVLAGPETYGYRVDLTTIAVPCEEWIL